MNRTPGRTIVVGGGSSGGVLATRLAERGVDTLLLEAGPDYQPEELPEELSDGDRMVPQGAHDWEFEARFTDWTDHLRPYPRGRVMGGSSAVNGASAARGIPEDFDGWAALGNDQWAWPDVLPFFRVLETDPDFVNDCHGQAGPVPMVRRGRGDWPRALQAFAQACEDRGYAYHPDGNDPLAQGIGPATRNLVGQRRASTWQSYVNPARRRSNLQIVDHAEVVRLRMDGVTVTGVEARVSGHVETFEAVRVVLSAGAVNSPRILWHSGIGDRVELAAAGIECRVHLPGVGHHLQDHPLLPIIGIPGQQRGLQFGPCNQLRFTSATGLRNDLMIGTGVHLAQTLNFPIRRGVDFVVFFAVSLARPFSRGRLSLVASDPLVAPRIDLRLLSDGRDLARIREGARLAWEIVTTEPVAGELVELLAPPPSAMESDDVLDTWIRTNVASALHMIGTCRMGPDDDEGAVVDQFLRVRGVDRLFVCDASVMPTITCASVNITCYMLGEAAIRFLVPELAINPT